MAPNVHSQGERVFPAVQKQHALFLSRCYLLTDSTRCWVVGRQTDGNTRWLALQSVVFRPDQTTDLVLFDSCFRTRARAIPTGI